MRTSRNKQNLLGNGIGRKDLRVRLPRGYFNMQKLMERIRLGRLQGHEIKFFEKIVHADLLILDDFGMRNLEGQQQNDF